MEKTLHAGTQPFSPLVFRSLGDRLCRVRGHALALGVLAALLLSACQTPPSAPIPAPSTTQAPAATARQSFDIYLAALDIPKGKADTPRNITQRNGYDNQPAFLPDSTALLFASDRSGPPNDIFRFDLATGRTSQVTTTASSEFSPTPTPDGKGFSVIRVVSPNAQGTDGTNPPVWRYSFEGQPLAPVVDVLSVGYHAWLNAQQIALFVVGDSAQGRPHELVLVNRQTGQRKLLTQAPGRQLGRTPDGQRISFVDKSDTKRWVLRAMGSADLQAVDIVALPAPPDGGLAGPADSQRSEDYCWLPDGSLVIAQGTQLLRFRPGQDTQWQPWLHLGPLPGTVRRLAVSPDGRQLAFVLQRSN
jgi:Tol biopolymer transport system component